MILGTNFVQKPLVLQTKFSTKIIKTPPNFVQKALGKQTKMKSFLGQFGGVIAGWHSYENHYLKGGGSRAVLHISFISRTFDFGTPIFNIFYIHLSPQLLYSLYVIYLIH